MSQKLPLRAVGACLLTAALLLALGHYQALAAQDAPAPGASIAAESGANVNVNGELQWVDLETPHWEVGSYVLVLPEHSSPDSLKAYAGQQVQVFGTRVDGPSIFMKSVLKVSKVMVADGTTLVGEKIISPRPNAGGELQPFNGSSDQVIFGQMTRVVGIWRTDDLLVGKLVFSSHYDLSLYTGQKVAAVVRSSPGPTGEARFEVLSLVRVGQDLGAGDALLYRQPAQPMVMSILGKTVDRPLLVGNSHVLLPLRVVATALGAAPENIAWDQATQTATVTLGDRMVRVTVGSNLVSVQKASAAETQVWTDVAPVIANGSTLVPVRVLVEGLGAQVDWHAETSTVTITK